MAIFVIKEHVCKKHVSTLRGKCISILNNMVFKTINRNENGLAYIKIHF